MRPACSAAWASSRRSRAELLATGVADGDRAFNLTWHDWLNLRSLVEISKVIALAALKRENSRGAHYPRGFPRRRRPRHLDLHRGAPARRRARHHRRAGAVHHRQAGRELAEGGRGVNDGLGACGALDPGNACRDDAGACWPVGAPQTQLSSRGLSLRSSHQSCALDRLRTNTGQRGIEVDPMRVLALDH